jgi:hypothetical protein
MIGGWVGTAPDRTVDTTFEWTKNKNFIKRTFTSRRETKILRLRRALK